MNIGPPNAFPSSRELPPLNSSRAGSAGGGMSISAMLGGSAANPNHREPTPGGHPAFAAPPTTTSVSGPAYTSSVHASPRLQATSIEYNHPYSRRPQTPDQGRPYDTRDPRGSVAGSPPQPMYGTPEVARFSTPQGYPARGPPGALGDDRREPPVRLAAGNMPPRPNSQPRAMTAMGSRPVEVGRGPPPGEVVYGRREDVRPGQMEFAPEGPPRTIPYEEHHRLLVERDMREHLDREAELRERDFRERELRERELRDRERMQIEEQRFLAERGRLEAEREREMRMRDNRNRRERTTSDPSRHGQQHPADFGPQGLPRQPPSYGRPDPRDPRDLRDPRDPRDPRDSRDPRDPASWPRPGYDQPPGPPVPYDQPYPPRPNEFPSTTAGPYGTHPAYAHHPPERFPPTGPPPHAIPTSQPGPPPVHPYDSPERQRLGLPLAQHHMQQAAHRARPGEEGPPPPSVAYNPGPGYMDTRPRPVDDGMPHNGQPRGLLNVQEMNRKGRVSPLPQAVQGAQPQLQGPADEPRIKSEFGRMFSGIGSGVRGIGAPSPVPGSQVPHTNATLARRDEDVVHEHVPEPVAKPARKRRKAKDDDGKGDDDSAGRSTPVGRGKRAKTHAHHHHHQYVQIPGPYSEHQTNATSNRSHHHHHHHAPERTTSPLQAGNALLKNLKSTTPIPSPTGKEFGLTHHHQPPRSTATQPPKTPIPTSAPIPKPKKRVASQAVIDSVADRPRKHLGDVIYKVQLKPAGLHSSHSKHGFTSTPVPLPKDRILNNENSTLTVKVPRAHLTSAAREEITSRRAIWGTDVYTDDSDVVAACIHAGWIRGEWGENVEDLLDLHKPASSKTQQNRAPSSTSADEQHQEVLTSPPPTGPVHVPTGRDLHVTVLILPGLEKYSGSARYGISSREWGGVYNGHRSEHDGISFMIWSIRWVDGAAPQSRLRGRARRERMHKAMGEVLRSQVVNVEQKDIAPSKKGKGGGCGGGDGAGDAGVVNNRSTAVGIGKENNHLLAAADASSRKEKEMMMTMTNGKTNNEDIKREREREREMDREKNAGTLLLGNTSTSNQIIMGNTEGSEGSETMGFISNSSAGPNSHTTESRDSDPAVQTAAA